VYERAAAAYEAELRRRKAPTSAAAVALAAAAAAAAKEAAREPQKLFNKVVRVAGHNGFFFVLTFIPDLQVRACVRAAGAARRVRGA
jgi:hypothetical protein